MKTMMITTVKWPLARSGLAIMSNFSSVGLPVAQAASGSPRNLQDPFSFSAKLTPQRRMN